MLQEVLFSLGANLGEREKTINKAADLLISRTQLKDSVKSKFYETEPVGVKDQPVFLNIALKGFTYLSPEELIKIISEIEKELGRKIRARWSEREIDIDIILYGHQIISNDYLEIPHPRMHERNFVLIPANEAAPHMIHPVFKKTLAELLQKSDDKSQVKLYKA